MGQYIGMFWESNMRVNIVCDDSGWIYERFVNQIVEKSRHEIFINKKIGSCDVDYFLPYYSVPSGKMIGKSSAWFSHQEKKNIQLRDKFISSAKSVDMAISQSKKYADLLSKSGVKNVMQIMPGVDGDFFKQRCNVRKEKTEKLIVCVVGRQYAGTPRKNKVLVSDMTKLDFVELRISNGRVPLDMIPQFYADADVCASTGLIEGGPMSIQESQMVGTPIVAFENVGVVDEINSSGVIKAVHGNNSDFIAKLYDLWKNKKYLEFRDQSVMNKMRDSVSMFTWKDFVRKHDDMWEELNEK